MKYSLLHQRAQRIEKRKTQKQEKEIRTTEQEKTELIAATNSKETTQDTAKQVLRPVIEKKNTRMPLPASIKHAIALRDQGRCTYVDMTGQQCTERRWLHAHHLVPVSGGGTNDISNLMTLCSHHHATVHQLSLF